MRESARGRGCLINKLASYNLHIARVASVLITNYSKAAALQLSGPHLRGPNPGGAVVGRQGQRTRAPEIMNKREGNSSEKQGVRRGGRKTGLKLHHRLYSLHCDRRSVFLLAFLQSVFGLCARLVGLR